MLPLASRAPRAACLLAAASLLGACGGGGAGGAADHAEDLSGNDTPATPVRAQKGPFLPGATLTAHRLAADGSIVAGSRVSAPVLEAGTGRLSIPWEGPTLLEVAGHYFDELRGAPSAQPARLLGLHEAAGTEPALLGINLFTHLEAERALQLLRGGEDFHDALSQAGREVKQLFGLSLPNDVSLGALDIAEGVGPRAGDNAQLLYFSGTVLSTGGVEIVDNLTDEFASTGQLESGLAALAPYGSTVDIEALADNLERLVGVSEAPRSDDLVDPTPIWVTPVNDLPVAVADAYTLAEDSTLEADLAANDTGLSDGGIVYTPLSPPANGDLQLQPDGRFSYTPHAEFAGADAFSYAVRDAGGDADQGQVSLTVTPVNDLPVAVADAYTLTEDSTLEADLAANDAGLGDGGIVYTPLSPPANGDLQLQPDGRFSYTPHAEFAGADAFSYAVRDAGGDADQGQVSLEVRAVNDPPTARFDALATREDEPLNILVDSQILANDTDADEEPLDIHSVQPGSNRGGVIEEIGSGSWTYRPPADFWGFDQFAYTVSDGIGQRATATVLIYVLPVDDQPRAEPDAASVREGAAVTLEVLTNDSGLGDGVKRLEVSPTTHGEILRGPDNAITYRSFYGFFGQENFTYSVEDEDGDVSVGSVTILIDCADCDSATLSWEPPTTNLDGSELTDLAGYKVYMGIRSGQHEELATIDNPDATTYVIPDLRPGDYYFVVTAFNERGLEGPPSNEARKGIPCARFRASDFPGKAAPPPCSSLLD